VEFRLGIQQVKIFNGKVPDFGRPKLSNFSVNIEALP
jgi:hypothetical protein